MKVSIAIACYEMNGRGVECLDFALQSIGKQRYPDIEVVISDHSKNDEIEQWCAGWSGRLPIVYARYEQNRGSSSANHNNAIRLCSGDIIKVLCQDDYLYSAHSISQIVKAFTPQTQWLVSDYVHTKDRRKYLTRHRPRLTPNMHTHNSIGTHSCLTIRRGLSQRFDENLIWLMDCELYRRLYDAYGPPAILHKVTMVVYLWEGQVTNTLVNKALQDREFEYVVKKHATPLSGLLEQKPPTVFERIRDIFG